MTPENKVKAAVKKLLTVSNIYFFMPPANGFGRSGIPDIIACNNGHFLAIECKAGKGVTTTLQDRELAAIRAAGGTAMVVNESNIDDLGTYINTLADLQDIASDGTITGLNRAVFIEQLKERLHAK